jgi:hypothetical protein
MKTTKSWTRRSAHAYQDGHVLEVEHLGHGDLRLRHAVGCAVCGEDLRHPAHKWTSEDGESLEWDPTIGRPWS